MRKPVEVPVEVVTWKHVDGYEAVPDDALADDLESEVGEAGWRIVSCSGKAVRATYRLGRTSLWRRAARAVTGPEGLARFMSEFGLLDETGAPPVLHRFLAADRRLLGERFEADAATVGVHIRYIQDLARCMDVTNAAGELSPERFRAEFIDTYVARNVELTAGRDGDLVVRLPSLLRFMVYEAYAEFGGTVAARPSVRRCDYCNKTMKVGGRRSNSKRRDARFCGPSCRVAAHNLKKSERA